MIDAVIITTIKHRVLMDREVIKFNGLTIQKSSKICSMIDPVIITTIKHRVLINRVIIYTIGT